MLITSVTNCGQMFTVFGKKRKQNKQEKELRRTHLNASPLPGRGYRRLGVRGQGGVAEHHVVCRRGEGGAGIKISHHSSESRSRGLGRSVVEIRGGVGLEGRGLLGGSGGRSGGSGPSPGHATMRGGLKLEVSPAGSGAAFSRGGVGNVEHVQDGILMGN